MPPGAAAKALSGARPVASAPAHAPGPAPAPGSTPWTIGEWRPIRTSPLYLLAIIFTSIALVLLPLIYLALVAGVIYGVYWHFAHNSPVGTGIRSGRLMIWAFAIYLIPGFVGACVAFFMLKPIIAPRPRRGEHFSVGPHEEPKLFAFVQMVCVTIGAPLPKRIDVVCDVNASASFKRGWLSLLIPGDLVLTIGMPLAAGLSTRDFAGVLAHEFGHFTQGAGMRAGFVIEHVIHWLARSAYQRDGWDEKLEEWQAESEHPLPMLIVAFMRLGVWLSRIITRVLLYIGLLFSRTMARQMEFDADRYEARFSGSESFERTTKNIHVLMHAFHRAVRDAHTGWKRDKTMPDDLAALTALAAQDMTPEERARLELSARDDEHRWYDTHPSPADRVKRARAMEEPGVFTLEAPTSTLFSDFEGACKKATYGFFRGVMGPRFFDSQFVEVAKVVAPTQQKREGRGAVAAFVGFEPPTWRPLFPSQSKLTPPEDPRGALAKLKAAADRAPTLGQAARGDADAYREHSERVLQCETAKGLFALGVSKLPATVGLRSTNRHSLPRELEDSRAKAARASERIDAAYENAQARLGCATRLLCVKGIEVKLPDAEALRKRASALIPMLAIMREVLPKVMDLRVELARLAGLSRAVNDDPKRMDEARKKLRPLSDEMRNRLDDIRRIAGGAPAPDSESHLERNLGEFIVGASPGWREYDQIVDAATHCEQKFAEAQRAAIAELVGIVLKVEAALKIAPGATPPAPKA